ncbi:hypothetical protein HF888_11155 [Bermanella marisrubri]|uniref:Methyl-accepting chemotaxis protein n=1 Tax=Bermanella marisrubri TaxID=207949 RepID=Q1N1B6_9GAMM|nr:hypothetical protein [Bermanella marisrubri]EAT11935.1 methyl-accepting chemotaxis protein [Oceanobacter sp. RED65] [Bermanella marisrubri]QIZ84741.1 hypothetical protein HF888_11155 [Bermanella marisrubri]
MQAVEPNYSQSNTHQIANQTAIAASISGHLHKASLIAQRMALTAKNSRAMVLRAGSAAAGLKVISDYFGELATRTIELSKTINVAAISISQNSVKQWQTQGFVDRVYSAYQKLESKQQRQLQQALDFADNHLNNLNHNLRKELSQLDNALGEIQQFMQSSNVVAVTFRLEATQTGEFQPMLEAMANNISKLTDDIKALITMSSNMLHHIKRD